MISRILASAALLMVVSACQSTEPLVPLGIQPKYHALNPSRILAVPVFVLPDPSKPAIVDKGILETGQTISILESEVLEAFKNQPGVNGISFSTVRRELGKAPNAWTKLNDLLAQTAKKVSSTSKHDQTPMPEKCHERKNVIDFYVYCVSPSSEWKNALNALSTKAFNADSALLIVLSHANKRLVKENYTVEAGVSAMLVDTNNASLIWSREGYHAETASPSQHSFPEWDGVFNKIFTEKFWAEFPGRTPKI